MSFATVFPVSTLLAMSLTLAAPLAASEAHDHHHGEPTHDHHDHSGQGDHHGHDHHAHDDHMHDHDAHEHRWEAPSDAAARDNPHAADDSSIRMGREAYRAQCLACHGEAGAGDGPQARALESRPADLREHAGGHTAGEYHWVIREGSGEMPAFAGVLDDDEIWHVVNYIRYELADVDDAPSDDHDGHHAPDGHDDHDQHSGGHHGMRIKSVGAPVVTLALAGLLTGCGDEAPEAAKERAPYPIQGLANIELYGDPQVGRERFAQSCAECHGADARGTEQGPALIHRIYEPSHHADITFFIAVERGVVAHHWEYGDMPPVPGLDHQDVADIVAWVRHEQRDDGIIPDDEWPVDED